jgi:hypothetical protein
MVNMSVRQRYKLLQVSSGMGNGRLEDNSVVKPHMLLKNSALDLRESNGPVELEPYQNCVFSNECAPIQNSTRLSYQQIAITPGHNSGP